MTGRPAVSIVTSGHDVADARLQREVAAFQRAGLMTEVLGLGKPDDAPPGAVVKVRQRPGLAGRALAALVLPWQAKGRVLVSLDPDSAVGCAIRRALIGPRRVKWVADVHEDYGALLQDRTWAHGAPGLLARWLVKLGEWVERRADLTVVVDDYLLPGAPRRRVVRNTPDLDMLPPIRPRDAQPRALYVGDLRPSRGLMAMLEALAGAPEWRADLVGPVRPSDQAAVDALLARHVGLSQRVTFHGRQPPRRAWELAAGAWAGLVMLANTVAFRETMPSKIYEYLACGLPIVTTPLPRPARLIQETGAGQVVEGAEQAGAVLRHWAASQSAYTKVADAAQRAGENLRQSCGDMDRFAELVSRLAT